MISVQTRPRISITQAQSLAMSHYNRHVVAQELPSERDQNFLLHDEGGEKFVLKIANRGEDREVLDFQNQVLRRVHRRDPSLAVPDVIPSKAGQTLVEVTDDGGESYFARLFTYLPGKPLAIFERPGANVFQSLGRLLGRLDKALIGYWHPAAERDLLWSVLKADQVVNDHKAAISDPEGRAIVDYFLAEYKSQVIPYLPYLRQGVIHNDGNDHNVLVKRTKNGEDEVCGLIDFGDMVYGPYVYEPAVASAYAMLNKDDPLEIAAQLLAGFHTVFPMLEEEVDLFFHFICLRLCNSVTLSAVQSSQEPNNPYLTVSEQQAWILLSNLIAIDPLKAINRFRQACGMVKSQAGLSATEIVQIRQQHLGPSLSISYKKPLKIVRGFRQYLYDEDGRAYLDAVNNVPHVGHCHPKVVQAGQRQMGILNTNTRYLHDNLVRYAERLCDLLPEPLRICFFVCTGSEANELALRLAKTHTAQEDIVVIDGAYHGNTNALVDISPYKYDGPGGHGAPEWVHKVTMPDLYRGHHRADDPESGQKYAKHVEKAIRALERNGRGIAAFICESVLGCGGQIVLPEGYLQAVFKIVRDSGGVCIADEVQVGFGRVGTHMWGFETQGVIPDIVTMGKPIGNGHPLAAVVTTPEIAASFATGMEYFNTFGGNPVSCAIGLAVLEVLEKEQLQEHARQVGDRLKRGLEQLQVKHALIGDVRGIGLFLGIELVRDRETLEPAAEEASAVVEQMKERGILISTDGPLHNVIKIKPPLVFSRADADHFVRTLDAVLTDLG